MSTTLMKSSLVELARELKLDTDVESIFDEYALEYIAEVLKESSDLNGSFDVDTLTSVLAGYLPQLEDVEREEILSWIVATSEKMQRSTASHCQCESTATLPPNTRTPGNLQSEGELTAEGVCSPTSDVRNHQSSSTDVRNHQSSSTDVRNHQFSSTDVRNHQSSSSDVRNHQSSSTDVRNHQSSSTDVRNHQSSSSDVRNHQSSSSDVRNHQSSSTDVKDHESPTTDVKKKGLQCDQTGQEERLLKEMFPDVSEDEIHEVYVSEAASLERTVERLVQLGGVQGAQDTRVRQLKSHGRKEPKTSKSTQEVDSELKAAIISRYSYVDVASDGTTHKPVILQNEVSKKTRYRDNQIVSTKGERFTISSKKDLESEEMKKTYINLKPLKHYRFH